MSLSQSLLAYEDIETIMNRALDAPSELRVTFGTHGEAVYFRQRVYQFRILDRKRNTEILERGAPLYGHSVFDSFTVQVPKEKAPPVVVVIKKISTNAISVEEF